MTFDLQFGFSRQHIQPLVSLVFLLIHHGTQHARSNSAEQAGLRTEGRGGGCKTTRLPEGDRLKQTADSQNQAQPVTERRAKSWRRGSAVESSLCLPIG